VRSVLWRPQWLGRRRRAGNNSRRRHHARSGSKLFSPAACLIRSFPDRRSLGPRRRLQRVMIPTCRNGCNEFPEKAPLVRLRRGLNPAHPMHLLCSAPEIGLHGAPRTPGDGLRTRWSGRSAGCRSTGRGERASGAACSVRCECRAGHSPLCWSIGGHHRVRVRRGVQRHW